MLKYSLRRRERGARFRDRRDLPEGARRIWPLPRGRSMPTLPSIWRIATILVTGSSCATAAHREDVAGARGHRTRSTTSGSTGRAASARGSTVRSCCLGAAQPAGLGGIAMLYLHGLSTGDFVPALSEFFGDEPGYLDPSSPPDENLQDEQALSPHARCRVDYVYIWVDGIHFNVRLARTGCAVWSWSACGPTAKRARAITGGYASRQSPGEPFERLQAPGMRAPCWL